MLPAARDAAGARSRMLRAQQALVDALCDPRLIDHHDRYAAPSDDLRGFDVRRIALLAQLAHGKRMTKIAAVMPATCVLLGDLRHELEHRFAAAHRPVDPGSLTNALQFYLFLRRWWRSQPPTPPALPDVAWSELALALTRRRAPAAGEAEPAGPAWRDLAEDGAAIELRRAGGVRLREAAFDVRDLIVTGGAEGIRALRRPVYLATSRTADGMCHLIELDRDTFHLLRSIGRWEVVIPGGGTDERAGVARLLGQLEQAGLIELRPSRTR